MSGSVLAAAFLCQVVPPPTVEGRRTPEQHMNELIDRYVLPPFNEPEFRGALARVTEPQAALRLFERVDRESAQVRSELQAAQADLIVALRSARRASEMEQRAIDALQKRVAIFERQQSTLDKMQVLMALRLPAPSAEAAMTYLLRKFSGFSTEMKVFVLDAASKAAGPTHAKALSALFCGEREPQMLERFQAALNRLDLISDEAAHKLCSIAEDRNQTRRFRRKCMKTLAACAPEAILPRIRKLLDSEVVGSEAYDVYRKITGAYPILEE
jgi:hypothetical protein